MNKKELLPVKKVRKPKEESTLQEVVFKSNAVALDIAETLGLAIKLENNPNVYVIEIKEKHPVLQLEKIQYYLNSLYLNANNTDIYLEKFVFFNGFARAISSLLKRYGYIYWTLEYNKFSIHEINLSTARAVLPSIKGTKKKEVVLNHFQKLADFKLTDNESDAIIMLNNLIIPETKIMRLICN